MNRLPVTVGIGLLLTISVFAATDATNPQPGSDGDTAEDWQPQRPMPDEFDWIKLTSGEWLKGEIVSMIDEKLEFDSDKLDLLELDWEDVEEIRSAEVMQVMMTGREVKTGKLLLEGDRVFVLGEEAPFERSQVITIAAGEPKEINYWAAKVSVGSNLRQGNSDLGESSARVRVHRLTARNRVRFNYLGNYNTALEEVTANNHRASLGWDKILTDRFFVLPVVGEYFRDPFQNISRRLTLGAGVGYDLIDTGRVDWRLMGGPAYQETQFESVDPEGSASESTPALFGSTVADVEITSAIDFNYEYRFQIVNEVSGTYNHHMLAGLEFELTRRLDFDVTLIWDRIEDPRPDSDGNTPEPDDFQLILGLGLDF